MTTFSESLPAALLPANRTGCGGRLVELLLFAWIVAVSFACQLWGWSAAAFGADATPLDATLLHALLLAAPLLPLAFFWRAPRERAIYRALLLATLYLLVMAPARWLPPTASQLLQLLQLGATAIFLVLLSFAGSGASHGKALAAAWPAALGAAAIASMAWLRAGAAGSPLDVLLALLLGAAFGAAFALVMQRAWFATLRSHTRGRGADLMTGGVAAGMALLIMASALSFNGAQLMFMLALPALGWLAVALAYAGDGYDWRPPALFIGLGAFAMLALTDTDTMAAEALDPALGWIAGAAALTALAGWALLLVVLLLRHRWGTPGRPALAATATLALLVAAGAIYAVLGQPGFHGDRLFVILAGQADVSAAAPMDDYDARRQFVYATLVNHAEASQRDLRQTLDRFGIGHTPYYLVNAVEVEGGLLARLLLSTRSDVDRILPSPRLRPLPAAPPVESGVPTLPGDHAWNLRGIGADRVWNELGVRGAGIVVGESDSGVQGDHPEVADSYRGRASGNDYNWFDPWSHTPAPVDFGGHGTHTTATVAGNSVGVAPDAEWIGCVNLQRNLGNPALYLDCMQFMLAPFALGGDPLADGDPTQSAHVLNNSWGCPASHEGCDPASLQPAVDALRAAGIFVVASAGNSGPQCSTVEDPIAIYDSAFTVGAVDEGGNLAPFSSTGPVTADGSGRTKPDIAAPGMAVWSAFPGNTYKDLDGTSMAGPHLAGVVALMWSANPTLIGDIDGTEAILRQTARPFSGAMASLAPPAPDATQPEGDTPDAATSRIDELLTGGGSCLAELGAAATPNDLVGYGIVDAYAAVRAAMVRRP